MDCLSEKMLSSYLDEELSGAERAKIEGHISKCNRCLDFLLVSYEALSASRKVVCPKSLKDNLKRRLGLKEKKKHPGLGWFFGALILFALSFVFKRYFLQFLVASAVLGFKWAMEGEGAKRVVMIFKGMHREEKNFERKSPPFMSDIMGGDRDGKAE